jgi:hypothetical protein
MGDPVEPDQQEDERGGEDAAHHRHVMADVGVPEQDHRPRVDVGQGVAQEGGSDVDR